MSIATFLQKVQGTPRSFRCIPWLLWTFRSVTPLLQGSPILQNKPCATRFHLEQLNKSCTAMCHPMLPCTCSTRSWHCAHDHPLIYTSTECKTRENSNFLKNGKMVISVKIENFYKSQMTKQTLPLESSLEI